MCEPNFWREINSDSTHVLQPQPYSASAPRAHERAGTMLKVVVELTKSFDGAKLVRAGDAGDDPVGGECI